MILPILFAQPSSAEPNVTLDDEQLQDKLPKSVQKVELDLDDALFLQLEESTPAPPPEKPLPSIEAELVLAEAGTFQVPMWKKIWFLGIVVLLFMSLSGVIAFILLRPTPEAPVLDFVRTEEDTSPLASTHPERQFSLKPFMVEIKQKNTINFLTYAFAIPYTNSTFHRELEEKTLLLRDAVYQYLTSSDLKLPDDPDSIAQVKQQTIALVNNIMETGQISSLYIAEYGVH